MTDQEDGHIPLFLGLDSNFIPSEYPQKGS